MAVYPKWTIFALVMKTRQELTEILDFIAEYATYLLGSGVHTSRVIRNSQRIGASQGVDLQLSSFQKSTIITAHDEESGEAITRVVKIPALPISFERNSDLSALSWDALDERLPLSEIRRRYDELTAKPRIDPIFVLLTVGLANASFCRLFGGDWIAMSIVFTSTLVGFAAKQRMQARREPLPDLHHLGVHGVAVRLGSPEVRLFGGNGARDERPVPRTGGTAHQWRDRHRRGAHSDRVQPPDQRPAAYHLHRHRPVGDIVNG